MDARTPGSEASMAGSLRALVLAGGSGSRFWPLSRRDRPKQLLPFAGGASLLRRTLERLEPLAPSSAAWVSTTVELRDAIARELPELPAERIVAEPEGRNTAPAIAWALAKMPARGDRSAVAVLPSDHHVADDGAFRAALAVAAVAAEDRRCVVTLGVPPERAETGFGYLELGAPAPAALDAVPVERFVEKPDAETARAYVAGGRHLWNAGIFVLTPEVLFAHLERHQPEIHRAVLAVRAGAASGQLDDAAEARLYAELPAVSIDHGVMERLARGQVCTVPLRCGWSDLGSWEALAAVLAGDDRGNRHRGDVLALDAHDNVLFADAGAIAVLGVEGLVVVRSGDAVLVVPRERSQEVRRIVAELARAGRRDLL
jgi:mannose-1-phosphate guanylyltransferase